MKIQRVIIAVIDEFFGTCRRILVMPPPKFVLAELIKSSFIFWIDGFHIGAFCSAITDWP